MDWLGGISGVSNYFIAAMAQITIDWQTGSIFINHVLVDIDEAGTLVKNIRPLFSSAKLNSLGAIRYRLNKASVYGFSAELYLDVVDARISILTVLFDCIQYMDKSILESKILKIFQEKSKARVESAQPAVASLEAFDWGVAGFNYDPKQGDLSFTLAFRALA